ncbi:MAG: hypothetical protein ACK5M4_11610 [Pseudorhodobacter sp.]
MLFDLIVVICAGFALAGTLMILRRLSGNRLPGWLVPASAGLGMLTYAIWSEYSWYDRVTGALPDGVVVLSAPAETMPYRPWTYLRPLHLRFLALDGGGMTRVAENPDIRRARVLAVARWQPVATVDIAVDCAGARRADLFAGAQLMPDGSLTGAKWRAVPPQDSLLSAACKEG